MQADWPLVSDLVLVGGGHAHALVARMWGMDPMPGGRVTIVNPNPAAPYTGMLPGHIAGHYPREALMIDLVRLARFAGARLILDRAVGIDREKRLVLLEGRAPIRFDVASVDVGIGSGLPELPGFAAHGVAAKPLGDYAQRWEAFVARRLVWPRVVVIGAGVGGAELALASMHRLHRDGAKPQVTLIDRAPEVLPGVPERTRARLMAELEAAEVAVLAGVEPVAVERDAVVLADGRRLGSDFTLSVAGARGQGWLAGIGLEVLDGHLVVGPSLQTSDPAIFAAGDCAHLSHAPRPKAGVYAVRAAPVLAANLKAALAGGRMRSFQPQRDYLKLISLGDRRALADRSGLRAGGGWLWRWKDRIDRRFMAMFEEYPAMPGPVLPAAVPAALRRVVAERPLCAGCGAKVGPGALSSALTGLGAPGRADVLSGPGDDAAVLAFGSGVQVVTTDHLRAFTPDAGVMARIAAVHALGDVWAMGAKPQAVLAQVILPRLGPELQAEMLAEVMEAAGEVVREAGADLVGGHTTIGAELTLGFTVTGLAGRVVAKGGAQPGDALVLTKAIGVGVILAAEMGLARVPGMILGEAWAGALSAMSRSLGPAAAVLAPEAHAMTDVTGFGLAGHLLEMLDASGCSAELELGAVPVLPGALELAAAGWESSLAPANRAAVDWRMEAASGPRVALLADPQTGGGLLAAVPGDRAGALVAALRALGEPAAVIGRVEAGPVEVKVRG